MESKLPRACSASSSAPRSGSPARSSRRRCATRSPAPTSSGSASARARRPSSRSSRSTGPGWVSAAAVVGAVTVSVVVRLVAGTVGGFRLVLVGIGDGGRPPVGDPVPLHPRRRLRRAARPALAHRQRQPCRLAHAPTAGRHPARAAAGVGLAGAVASGDRTRRGHRRWAGCQARARGCPLCCWPSCSPRSRGCRRADRLRVVPRRSHRPGAERGSHDPGRCRARWRRDRRRGRLRRRTTCWPTPTSRSGSSPALSARRSCSGCWPAAAPEGGRHDCR